MNPEGHRHALMAAGILLILASACSGGSAVVSSDPNAVDVGLVLSLTGASSSTAGLAAQGAKAALARAGSEHMAGARHIRFVEADDGSSPDIARRACARLVAQQHVAAIVGFESAAALDGCNRAASSAHIPYFAAVPSGVPICDLNVFVFGFTPNQQLTPLIDYLNHKQAAKTFYIVATDDPVVRSSVDLAAVRIRDGGGVLLGTVYRSAKTADYGPDIAKIATARPDVVLDGLLGDDQVAYHSQFRSDARMAGIKQASLGLDAASARSIGSGAVGIYVAQDYNSNDSSPATKAWLTAIVSRFGDGAVPSAIGAEMYDATVITALAIGQAQSSSGEAIARAVGAVSFEGPRGPIHVEATAHGYATASAHIGRVSATFSIDQVDVIGPVSPLACLNA